MMNMRALDIKVEDVAERRKQRHTAGSHMAVKAKQWAPYGWETSLSVKRSPLASLKVTGIVSEVCKLCSEIYTLDKGFLLFDWRYIGS